MVSVIVPVYNAEKTLPSCVKSILDQTYLDYELILIDDGSTDSSGRICDELQENCRSLGRLCQVVHQENHGVSAARNRGMELAEGKYFVCIDSDDVIESCYLEDLFRTAEQHPEFGHVLCGFRCTSHAHNYILTDREQLSVRKRSDYMLLSEKILIQSPCLQLYQTDVVRSHGIKMREDLSLAEDLLFNLAYLDALGEVSIGVINKANYVYRDEEKNSLNRRYRSDLLGISETVNQSVAYCLESWGITDETSRQLYYKSELYSYIRVLENTFDKRNPMDRKERIAYNNAILKKKEFQNALQNSRAPLTSALRHALASGDYSKVLLAKRLQNTKGVLSRLLKG